MFGELVDEFGKAARILIPQRQAARAMAIGRRDMRHAFFEHGFRQIPCLRLKFLVLVGVRTVAATGDDQRQRARGISHAEMERGEPAHRIAHDMRPLDAERVEHREDVVPRALLGIALDIRRHVRGRIAACVVSDATVTAREMA